MDRGYYLPTIGPSDNWTDRGSTAFFYFQQKVHQTAGLVFNTGISLKKIGNCHGLGKGWESGRGTRDRLNNATWASCHKEKLLSPRRSMKGTSRGARTRKGMSGEGLIRGLLDHNNYTARKGGYGESTVDSLTYNRSTTTQSCLETRAGRAYL